MFNIFRHPMAKTAAERQRQYRARRDADAERRETYLRSDRERWKRDTEAGKKKKISDLGDRAKRHKRKMWGDAKKRQKNREALRNSDTPPQTPDNQNAGQPRSGSVGGQQHLEGKKQSRRARYKLHKEIAQLQHALTKERKLKEKYKKRLQRSAKQNESPRSKVRELVKNCSVNSRIRKTLLLHEALISDIKRKYQNTRNERDKQILEQALGFSKKRRNLLKSKSLTSFTRKTVNRFADTSIQKNIKSFFNRDDVSRITTGRKQTVTRNKVKMQKRFLVDTMRNLHRKFLAENNVRISYSSFCRLRPFWVVHPSLSNRETCQCKLHENLSFLAEKLNQLKLIETSDLERLTKTVSCDTTHKDCMYGECENSKDKTVPLSSMYDRTEEKAKMDDQEGPKVKISVKQIVEGTQEQLAEQFHTHLSKFKKHSFNIRQQYAYYRELRKSMATDECLIHIDFSENFTCKYSSEIQAVHFGSSHQQATLHTGILCVGGSKESSCFSTISPSKHKSPAAIWEHLNPLLDYVQATHPEVSVIHFFSDGPCTQYKQKGNFFLFSTELAKRGIKAGTWNFFEASHGKGAPDGVGAALKRTADMLISHGWDIQDAHELFEALLETNTSIKLFFVNDDTVEQALRGCHQTYQQSQQPCGYIRW
ncbi:hypothetical protein Q7C36_005594 [Tachysurus vachellii]|uniref:Uncharacterized protein n=1 Tax=Tachysurus vachellii TaxID=175792 RepID=A0AA88NJ88_TACVA|nr:hypothetical protein Q7C36_005594 [Tachysurus vachellii]